MVGIFLRKMVCEYDKNIVEYLYQTKDTESHEDSDFCYDWDVICVNFVKTFMKEFGEELKRKLFGGHLWNPSYFVATVSENTEEQIRKYIKNQKRK